MITGGNIDPRVLAAVIMRGLVRSGRLSRSSVGRHRRARHRWPGWPRSSASSGGNIVEVAHQRLFSDLSVKVTELELAIETRDRQHTERIVRALEQAGYDVKRR